MLINIINAIQPFAKYFGKGRLDTIEMAPCIAVQTEETIRFVSLSGVYRTLYALVAYRTSQASVIDGSTKLIKPVCETGFLDITGIKHAATGVLTRLLSSQHDDKRRNKTHESSILLLANAL